MHIPNYDRQLEELSLMLELSLNLLLLLHTFYPVYLKHLSTNKLPYQ